MADDIKIVWDSETQTEDFGVLKGDLLRENGIETAVLISLFTDARASEEDDGLDDLDDRKGWWGDLVEPSQADDNIGSKLWLLRRSKMTNALLRTTKQYIEDALQWMIDDGVAAKIEVETERMDLDKVAASIKIFQTDGTFTAFKYNDLWEGI